MQRDNQNKRMYCALVMENSKHKEIWKYLKYGEYPEGATKKTKRDIWERGELFYLENEELL